MASADLPELSKAILLLLLKVKPSDNEIDIDFMRHHLSEQFKIVLENQVREMVSQGQRLPTVEESKVDDHPLSGIVNELYQFYDEA